MKTGMIFMSSFKLSMTGVNNMRINVLKAMNGEIKHKAKVIKASTMKIIKTSIKSKSVTVIEKKIAETCSKYQQEFEEDIER
jgi:hypothetical protein